MECVIFFAYYESNLNAKSTLELDEYSFNQWYLYEQYHSILKTNNDGNLPKDGFNENNGFNASNQIRVDSSLNLGIYSFWEKNNVKKKNKDLIIALIDTSVDISHEDLKDKIWTNLNEVPNDGIDNDVNGYIDDYYGWNFIDNNGVVNKNINEYSHGTHCAGIIAAEHNHIGTMGIAGNSNIKIMVLPAIENGGDEKEIQGVINAINYAESMGAQICNLSCTFSTYSKDLEKVIESSNMYFVVAAGNYKNSFVQGLNIDDKKRYPASFNFPNVITVGSLDIYGNISSASNYGFNTVDIAAPGEWIYSTLPNNKYGFMSGTSMATPIVTSVLALYYLYYDVDLKKAVNMLFDNAYHNSSLKEKITNERILHFSY